MSNMVFHSIPGSVSIIEQKFSKEDNLRKFILTELTHLNEELDDVS